MAAVYDLETIGELELDMTQQYEAMEFCTRYWIYRHFYASPAFTACDIEKNVC
jgi:hypothetical protein